VGTKMTATAARFEEIEKEFLAFIKSGDNDRKKTAIGGYLSELDLSQLKTLLKTAIELAEKNDVVTNDGTLFVKLADADNIKLAQFKKAIHGKVKRPVFRQGISGGESVDEGYFKADIDEAKLVSALKSMLGERASLMHVKTPPPKPVLGQAHFEFDVENDNPPQKITWRRNEKTGAGRKAAERLLIDPTTDPRYAGHLKPVNITTIINDVDKYFNTKSDRSAADSKDEARSSYKGDLHTQHLHESEMVVEGRILFKTEIPNTLRIGRISHLEVDLVKEACRVTQGSATEPVVVVVAVSAAILNAERNPEYTDLSQVSDETMMQNIAQKTLMRTSDSLIGTKIDHRFVSIRIRDDAGNPINRPDADQIKSMISAAIMALQANIIPKFDRDLIVHLDANFAGIVDTDPLKKDYLEIRAIQGTASSKKPADLKAAYNQFTTYSKYVGGLENQSKRRDLGA